jgi:hypothetical protein
MSNKNQQIADILDRNDYRVIVVDNYKGVAITFPAQYEDPVIDKVMFVLEYGKDKVTIHTYNEDNEFVGSEDDECPSYCQVSYLMYRLMKTCGLMQYPLELVKYIINDEDCSMEDFFAYQVEHYVGDGDKEKDSLLRSLMTLVLIHKTVSDEMLKYAEDNGILEGLEKLCLFFNFNI